MRMELSFDSDPRALDSVATFVDAAVRSFGLASSDAEHLGQLVGAAVKEAVESAYPPDAPGTICVKFDETAGKLEIQIRDYGLPEDPETLNRRLAIGRARAPLAEVAHLSHAADEIGWVSFGAQGKALRLIKWLSAAHVAKGSTGPAMSGETIPQAPQQHYDIRRMRCDEAVQVSQLMYRTYGPTYFNDDVYYPDRIAAANERHEVISVVAVGTNGHVAAHCALERNQRGMVAEIGQAAVDPAHRGRGLLDLMKAALEKEARALGLAGWYADAVTVHTFTQQSDAHHGGRVCGVDLAVSPKSESFRGIVDELKQRVSCVLYFRGLEPPQRRTLFVPPRHAEMVSAIYDNLGVPIEFGRSGEPGPECGRFGISFRSRSGLATIEVEQLGQDSVTSIRRAVRALVEQSRAEVVVVQLPLHDAAAVLACEGLEAAGMGFTGIGPHFSPGGDVLKLAYLVTPLAREPIKTFEPFAGRVVDYALAEQERVRANL